MVAELDRYFLQFSNFFSIFDTIPSLIIFTSTHGKILYSNCAFEKTSGYSKQELSGMGIQDLFSNNFVEFYNYNIKQNLETGKNWNGELEHKRKDNSIYWTSSSFTNVFNKNHEIYGYFIIEEDITPLKELTNQLEFRASRLYEEKLKIETILDNIPYSVIVIEQDGTILYKNEIFKTSFKNEFKRDLLVNSNITSYSPNIIIENIKKMMNHDEKGEMIIKLKSNINLQMNTISMNFGDKNIIFIVVIRDITNFIEFDLLQKQFVTSVSHELRTPIASILLSVNNYISYNERLSDDQKNNLLQIIQQNANVLKNIIDDLLIVSRIDNKKLKLRNWINLNLNNQINQVILQLSPQISLKTLKVTSSCEKYYNIFCDEERLSQIIRIPLENAIKYSFENQRIVITCSSYQSGKYNPSNKPGFLISIRDFGIGIKSSELKFLFRRFFRGSNVQNIQGTGIGLSILREIVSLVKGQVFIESEENKGTTVIIFLPVLENMPN